MTDKLEQAVADAIDQAHRDYFGNVLWTHDAAAAAIRVVRERIEALRDEPHTTPPCLRAHTAEDAYRRVLGVFDDES